MICLRCKIDKIESEFTKNYNECKDCRKIISKRYRSNNLKNKKFFCAACNLNAQTNGQLQAHFKTKKHIINIS